MSLRSVTNFRILVCCPGWAIIPLFSNPDDLRTKPGTDLRRGCHSAMRGADILFCALRQTTQRSRCVERCLALMDQQPMDWVAHCAEADRAALHNLCTCPHLRSMPHIGCLNMVRCASVFPALLVVGVLPWCWTGPSHHQGACRPYFWRNGCSF